MKAKSIKGNSSEAIKTALKQSMADGFKPTLAIVFLSVQQDRKVISQLLHKLGICVFGITSNGEFISEETQKGSTAILLLDIKKEYFELYFEEYPEKNYREIASQIATKAKHKFNHPAFIIGLSHSETDGEEILHGLEE